MPNSIVNQCRRPARRRWLIPNLASAFVAALCGGVLTTPSVVMAGDTAEPAADAQLAELFAPVVALRSQSSECGEGEPYYPVPVDVLFGRDDVVIRDAAGDVLVQGPTIDDLAGLDADSWIDIPGDALRPGCDYEQWFDALEAPPTVYARVVHDPEASQPIVVQYWFFYTYNDWNDRHEGDWEMVQVGFDESNVEAAIAAGPSVYAFAQHEGAEVARRGDATLTLVDATHPVVFPAAGSHATYFSSSRWFGKSAATGFGCDDTRAPLDEVRPAVVLLPADVPTTGEFAWLSFPGHWGEQQPSFNNGPTGPTTKADQWDAPSRWVEEEGRSSAVSIPFASTRPASMFCTLTEQGSMLYLRTLSNGWRALAVVLATVAVLVVAVRWSSRGVVRAAFRAVIRERRVMLGIGLIASAAVVLARALQYAVLRWTPVGDAADVIGTESPWVLPVVFFISSVLVIPAAGLVAASVAGVLTAGEDTDPTRSILRRRLAEPTTIVAGMIPMLALVAGSLLVLLAPVVWWIAGRYLVAAPAMVAEGVGLRTGLRRSTELLRGDRMRSLGLMLIIALVLLTGPLVGALVLTVTGAGFTTAGIIAALVTAVTFPFVGAIASKLYSEVTDSAWTHAGPTHRWSDVDGAAVTAG